LKTESKLSLIRSIPLRVASTPIYILIFGIVGLSALANHEYWSRRASKVQFSPSAALTIGQGLAAVNKPSKDVPYEEIIGQTGEEGGIVGPPQFGSFCLAGATQSVARTALSQLNSRYGHQSPGERTLSLSITSASNPAYTQQRVTIEDAMGATLRCATTQQNVVFFFTNSWSETPVNVTFAIEAFEEGTWQNISCSNPSEQDEYQGQSKAFTYNCDGARGYLVEVAENPYLPPKIQPPLTSSGVCGPHGGSVGNGFSNECRGVIELCQNYDQCRDGTKQSTSSWRMWGLHRMELLNCDEDGLSEI
jgi:hypothetical protein